MSFASEVKNEIARVQPKKRCCRLAETAGFIRACGSILLSGGAGVGLMLTTENPAVARHIKTLISEGFGISANLNVGNAGLRRGRHVYNLKVPAEKGAAKILRETGILVEQDGRWKIEGGLPEQILSRKCCRKACLKGLFLGAGTLSDPEKDYHLEIVFSEPNAAQAAKKLIGSFVDIHAKVRKRRESYVVYLRDSEQIKDILSITGAHTQLLRYENLRVLKEVRGRTNRMSNCDSANMDRALRAADRQTQAARKLKDSGAINELPEVLQALVLARLENPEATLAELGESFKPKLSKSTVGARMRRVEELAR